MTPLCFSQAGLIGRDAFAAEVAAFRERLATTSAICNLAPDRYHFMVALAAAFLEGRPTILPSSEAPEAVAQAIEGEAAPLVFKDWRVGDAGREDPAEMIAALRAAAGEVRVFTSGSTGAPARHLKSWRMLADGATVAGAALARIGLSPERCGLLGSTPHQHMYGLEAVIFACLAHDYPIHRRAIFYPADLEKAVAEARAVGIERLALITSPAHLRYLEAPLRDAPEIAAVISATAPLPRPLAERLEARGDLAVLEVYGSTETGSIAIRRTAEDDAWEPLAGFCLEARGERLLAHAPHLPAPTPLSDLIEILEDGRFRLLGRPSDMVSAGGKRGSLAALNEALVETAGVRDGVVLFEQLDGRDRIAAVAVIDPAALPSEEEARAAIRSAFHRRFDPVFTPRQIVFVDQIPRQGAGKLTAQAISNLKALLADLRRQD